MYSPAQVIAYVSDTWRGLHRRYLGHNPIGGVMALVLLTMLLVVSVSGVALYGIEDGGGPLAGMVAGWAAWEGIVEDVHEVSADVLWMLIGFHVIGIVVHYWHHRENLVTAMWTGRKAAISGSGSEEHRSVR